MHYSYYEKRCDHGELLRYYSARIDEDLFGHYILVKQWGAANQKSKPVCKSFETLEFALLELKQIAQSRKQHGFELVVTSPLVNCIHPE